MSDIPAFPYADLWGERSILSVADLTRDDGLSFFAALERCPVTPVTNIFALDDANAAIAAVRAGTLDGAAVLVTGTPTPGRRAVPS